MISRGVYPAMSSARGSGEWSWRARNDLSERIITIHCHFEWAVQRRPRNPWGDSIQD